jgi:hypothetical protein
MVSGGWQDSGLLYLLAAVVLAETIGKRGVDTDISLDTLLDSPDLAFRGAAGARRSPSPAVARVVYPNVGADKGASVGWGPAGSGSAFAVGAAASGAA